MKKKLLILPILFIMAALIINPSRYIRSMSDGIMIFVISVLPALFPFFFFTKLLTALGVAGNISRYMERPVRKLYNAPDAAGYIFVMSIMSGYPIGSKLLADFYELGAVSRDEAKRITAFTSTSGPLFILGTVGTAILGNYKAGVIILVSHYLSSIINGFIYRGRKKAESFMPVALASSDYDKALSESVYNAIISILTVGSYIALFNLIGDMLIDIKVLPLIEKGLTLILEPLKLPASLSRGISYSLIEMTKGCIYLKESGAEMLIIAPLAAMSITFGGLSICLQSLTYLMKCGISPFFYLKTKTTQCIIALAICIALCLAFKV